MALYEPSPSVVLNPEEFAQDEQNNLGRANGNTFQRKPGVPDVHDGQIMVRLKKKRFIILDYGHVPTEHDEEVARTLAHVNIPEGAGRARCSTKGCPRVGVPVLMYDSQPHEPMSLYARGGLCFSCQRNLNEKRRTNRKRKAPDAGHPVGEVAVGAPGGDAPSEGSGSGEHGGGGGYKFRYNDQIVELNPDAVVINGPVDGTRVRGPDYQCPEIGRDLLRIVQDLSRETVALLHHPSVAPVSGQPQPPAPPGQVDALYQRAFLSVSKATFLLTQWKASLDDAAAAEAARAEAAAAAAANAHFESQLLSEAQSALHGHAAASDAAGYPGLAAPTLGAVPPHNALDGRAPPSLAMPGDGDGDGEHGI